VGERGGVRMGWRMEMGGRRTTYLVNVPKLGRVSTPVDIHCQRSFCQQVRSRRSMLGDVVLPVRAKSVGQEQTLDRVMNVVPKVIRGGCVMMGDGREEHVEDGRCGQVG
jgi:hypothetical protein